MLDIIRSACPYPTIGEDGTLFDGLTLPQAKKCRQCEKRSCRSLFTAGETTPSPTHGVCEYDYSVVMIPTPWGALVINGVFVPNLNVQMRSEARKANRDRKIPLEEFTRYFTSVQGCEPKLLQAIDQRTTHVVS